MRALTLADIQKAEWFLHRRCHCCPLLCKPPGWQQRVTILELASGLRGHFLEAHDIAYNKIWAGRPKDIVWVRGLLETGIIRLARLIELHEGNPIPEEDLAKVRRSLDQVVLRAQ